VRAVSIKKQILSIIDDFPGNDGRVAAKIVKSLDLGSWRG
jgi:hypothetical protein